ncbi:TPM domain-containing protein [Flavobacterium sp. J372]|uniref:TPM domain-containing protein n=1 Tax=Flavobacterium sp. J372 TaxID=2898436 RepID=UPI002151EB60|nr:TPM domain-containing protein [Flavobacterium sp. J372]MCR5861606.1 TPM domain-containing protein [Flavobacterium sp. J372]
MKQLLNKFFAISLLLTVVSGFAQKIPPKPSLQTSYYEIDTQLLNDAQKREIEQKLIRYADSTSTQIVVVVVPNTGGDDIDSYKVDLAHAWGIGQGDKDNGVLLLIAKDDRKVAIATGYGTEHRLTDALSNRIIDEQIIPAFKAGNFYQGIDDGTTGIIKALNGEYKEERKNLRRSGNKDGIFSVLPFIILIIIIIIVISRGRGGGNRGNRGGGFDLADILILSSLGRSSGGSFGGFGGGGSSGGGFGGGFGGGGFGGGGASGSW